MRGAGIDSRRLALGTALTPAAVEAGQELVVVVAAHQVVRDRDAHSGCDRQRGIRPLREALQPFDRISGMTRAIAAG